MLTVKPVFRLASETRLIGRKHFTLRMFRLSVAAMIGLIVLLPVLVFGLVGTHLFELFNVVSWLGSLWSAVAIPILASLGRVVFTLWCLCLILVGCLHIIKDFD